jgi:serine/threonine protein kinase
MVGKSVSHYKIVGKLGQGGMGVVYRATDLRLERDVALKFLPDALAGDQQALERLKREARAGALSHPNICAVYDIGEDNGRPFICMELLEGETLEQRMARGSLSMNEVLAFGMQVAAALTAAHSKGVVHRDIKPSNIFLTEFDHIKLMDFGLARRADPAMRARVSETATATASLLPDQLTTPGLAIGTLVYMSPEQARGEEVDARTDLFSFGAVLYEMASGRRPFQGTNSALILDAILHADPPPPSRSNPAIPPELDAIILKALEKDRETRYQSAADIGADLKRLRRASESGSTTISSLPPPRSGKWWAIGALAAVLLLAAAYLFFFRSRLEAPAPQSEWVQLTNFTDSAVSPALSPDGRMLAFIRGPETFVTSGDLYVKMLPDGDPVQLTHDHDSIMAPAFSPDGSRVAYTAVGASWDTWVVPVLGGQPRILLPNAAGLTWTDPQHVLFSEIRSGMHMTLAAATEIRGEHRDIYIPARERGMVHRSALSPDGKWVLLAEMDNGGWLPCRLVPFDGSNAGHQVGPLKGGCTYIAWSPDGKWMYFSSDASGAFHLWRQTFSGGQPQQLTFGPTEEEGIAVAADGKSLITSVGMSQSSVWLHDNTGERQLSSEGSAYTPHFSTDGTSVYYLVSQAGYTAFFASGELCRTDLATGATHHVFPGVVMTGYAFSPDGKQVAYSTTDNGKSSVWVAPLDRRSAPRKLESQFSQDEPSFTPGGDLLVRVAQGGLNYMEQVAADGSRRQRVVSVPISEEMTVSPDGKWIAVRVANDDPAVPWAIVAFPIQGGSPVKLCTGTCIVGWSPNGRWMEMYFWTMGKQTTALVPLPAGKMIPEFARPPETAQDAEKLHGVRVIPQYVAIGSDPGTYLYTRTTVQRNLYRIPLR